MARLQFWTGKQKSFLPFDIIGNLIWFSLGANIMFPCPEKSIKIFSVPIYILDPNFVLKTLDLLDKIILL